MFVMFKTCIIVSSIIILFQLSENYKTYLLPCGTLRPETTFSRDELVALWKIKYCTCKLIIKCQHFCFLSVQVVLHGEENAKADLAKVEEILKSDKSITNVAMVHCETSTGVIHPVGAVGKLVKEHAPSASFFVDAMSSFGAVPLNLDLANIDFMVSSANKCIEGVPGFSFVIGHIESLNRCKGWARSLSLDIVDQYEGLEKNGQFRFTPATHAMLAFRRALSEFKAEGGVDGRANR